MGLKLSLFRLSPIAHVHGPQSVGCSLRPVWIQTICARVCFCRSRICSIAHAACSAINGSRSAAALSNAGRSDGSPTLPSATHTLRRNPRRFTRLIGDFLKSTRNSASVKSKYSRSDMPVVDRRALNSLSRDSLANRFQGQASRQSSQPKIRSPMSGRRSTGMAVFSSIVR